MTLLIFSDILNFLCIYSYNIIVKARLICEIHQSKDEGSILNHETFKRYSVDCLHYCLPTVVTNCTIGTIMVLPTVPLVEPCTIFVYRWTVPVYH